MTKNLKLSKFKLYGSYAAVFLLVWGVLLYLNLYWSRDISSYRAYFNAVQSPEVFGRLTQVVWLRDPGYFVLQNISVGLISFEVFIGLIIFASLLIKLMALMQIYPRISFPLIFPYLTLLGFMHEGTQLRVGLALSFCLWALVFWVQEKRTYAIGALLVGCLFHISSATYFLVFALIFLAAKFGVAIHLIALLAVVAFAFPVITNYIFLAIGEMTQARYMSYSQGAIFRTLNVTGLFQYYFIFFGLLGVFIWKYFLPTMKISKNWRQLALFCAIVAISFLFDFKFNTVVASRLADLMLLPIAVTIGLLLEDLWLSKRTNLYIVLVAILSLYCIARGYTVFSVRPQAPLPSVN